MYSRSTICTTLSGYRNSGHIDAPEVRGARLVVSSGALPTNFPVVYQSFLVGRYKCRSLPGLFWYFSFLLSLCDPSRSSRNLWIAEAFWNEGKMCQFVKNKIHRGMKLLGTDRKMEGMRVILTKGGFRKFRISFSKKFYGRERIDSLISTSLNPLWWIPHVSL